MVDGGIPLTKTASLKSTNLPALLVVWQVTLPRETPCAELLARVGVLICLKHTVYI